jgi:hypothetical protein
MKRRQFIHSAAISSTVVLAGCSTENLTETEPSLEVLELIQSESQLVSTDELSEDTFIATIQNTGVSGSIAVALFWQTSNSGEKPEVISNLVAEGYPRERVKENFFNSGERRTVEFIATPPESAIGYYFLTQPATYGANIQNTGSGGRATVTMTFNDSSINIENTKEQTVYIDSNSTEEVLFNATLYPDTDWEISVEPED